MRNTIRELPLRWIAAALLLASAWAGAQAADEAGPLREKALALNNVTGEDPILGEIRLLRKDEAGTKKLVAEALKMIKENEKEPPFNYNASLILAEAARGLKDVDASKTFFRICMNQAIALKSGVKLGQSYGGLIDMLYEAKRYEESEKICQEFLEMPSNDDTIMRLKGLVLRRQILVLAKEGKFEKAHKLVDDILQKKPDNWLQMELKAIVQHEEGKFADSAKTYETILGLVEKDKELDDQERKEFISEYKYKLSGIFIDDNQVEKAAEQLRALLVEDPDNPTYNNDLGYVMADHDMNLDESERLIRKAIEEERKLIQKAQPDIKPEEIKDNAAYLDSLGWVLFKKKQYKEAKEWLQKAVKEKEGQHVEIFDHLGDTHMALGEKAEAVAAYKKGLEAPSEGKREQQRKIEVEKKIKKLEASVQDIKKQ